MALSTLGKRRTDELRLWAGHTVEQLLGYQENTVVTAAIACLGKQLSEEQTQQQLSGLLEDLTAPFCNQLYLRYGQLAQDYAQQQSGKDGGSAIPHKHKKRGIEDVFGDDVDDDKAETRPTHRLKRLDMEDEEDSRPLQTDMNPEQLKEFMEKTMKQINKKRAEVEKQQEVVEAKHRSKDSLGQSAAKAYLSEAMSKSQKASALSSRINLRVSALQNLVPGLKGMPAPLVLDKEGRTTDSAGKTVSVIKHEPTLKVNLRESKRKLFKLEKPEDTQVITNPYFDPRMTVKMAPRAPKKMQFHERGKFVELAQKQRAKNKLEELQKKVAEVAKKTGISTVAKRVMLTQDDNSAVEVVPEVEWWDKFILTCESYNRVGEAVSQEEVNESISNPKYREITHLIEHPIVKPPPGSEAKVAALSVMLTKKERKKLRQQKRLERQREEQEKIRLGLIPPPPPKVRIANLMRVLCSEAVQDPTKVEANVRAQAAERQKKHEKANTERQLTKDQKREKKVKKLTEDTTNGVNVAVFRIANLSNPQHKYKVETNAQQYMLTGLMLLFKDNNLVVIEGGPKALRKYKRLMLNRIKWDSDVRNRKVALEELEKKPKNVCQLIWEGFKKTRSFPNWSVKQLSTDSAVREHLAKYNCHHYWDLALSESILNEENA